MSQQDEIIPGEMAFSVECGNCGKTIRAEPGEKEFQRTCDKCGHTQTYRSSDVKRRELQI